MDRAARPDGPAADPARIQPEDARELDDWLDDREFDGAAERLRRLCADEEILLALQLNNFNETSWEPLAQELARYGLAVMSSWIRRATIYEKVHSRTRFRLTPLEGWPRDEETIIDIASDTVITALDYFKNKVLMTGKWDPRRGASLRTYFIGQCLFKFPNQYRSHRDAELERRKNELLVGDDAEFAAMMGSIRAVEQTVIARNELATVLADIPNERLKSALILRFHEGRSYQEIADQLGLSSPKQVENMISYFQRKQPRRTG